MVGTKKVSQTSWFIALSFLSILSIPGKRISKARKPSPGKTSTTVCQGRVVLFVSSTMSAVMSNREPWPHSWELVVLVIRTFCSFLSLYWWYNRQDYLPWCSCTEEEHRCYQRRHFSTWSTFVFWLCPGYCLWYVKCLPSTLPFINLFGIAEQMDVHEGKIVQLERQHCHWCCLRDGYRSRSNAFLCVSSTATDY